MTNNWLPKILIFATTKIFFQIYTILQTKNASPTDETKISDHDKSDQEESDEEESADQPYLSTREIENLDSDHMDKFWINPNEILADKYIGSETEMEKTSGYGRKQGSLNGKVTKSDCLIWTGYISVR